MITELNAVDGTDRSFVYAGSKILAIIQLNGGSPQFTTWEHYDPSGSSYRSTYSNGDGAGGAEMDPLGADAGMMKPFTWNPPTGPGKLEPYYGIPELNSASSGCILDYIQVPCDMVTNDSSVQCENNQCKRGMEYFRAFSDGYSGYVPADGKYIGNGSVLSTLAAHGSLDELAGVVSLERNHTGLPQKATSITREQLMEQIKKNLANCGKQFGFDIDPESFIPVSSELPMGAVLVTGADHLGNGGNVHTFAIVHDAITYSSASLTKHVGSKAIGLTENEYGHTPYINYGVNDLVPSGLSIPANVDAVMLGTQVHELGNSLGLLAGWSQDKTAHAGHKYKTQAGDQDAGILLEHCVFGGHVSNFGKLQK